MFSIICIYNDRAKLNKYLINSLEKQNFQNYELLLMDNSNNQKYLSAVNAIEEAINEAKREYLMIVHQDVVFESQTTLGELAKYIQSVSDLGVAGIAGAPYRGLNNSTFFCIKQGVNKEYASNNRPNQIEECQTVDECLFFVPRKLVDTIKFTHYGNVWHLYAVDYCLNVLKQGYKVVVLPIKSVYHVSPGDSLDKTYYYVLRDVIQKHGEEYELIHTTMGTWRKKRGFLKIKVSVLRIRCFLRWQKNRILRA